LISSRIGVGPARTAPTRSRRPVTAWKDGATIAHQAAFVILAGVEVFSGVGELIHSTSGCRQQRVDRLQRRGCCSQAFS